MNDLFFFGFIEAYLQPDRIIILLGDFNCVCTAQDRSNSARFRDNSTDFLNGMVDRCELEDVAVWASSRREVQYTHFQNASHPRLDRAYVSLDLVRACKQYAVDHVSFSDHALVSFKICSPKEAPKKFVWGLWNFNAQLLKDDCISKAVRQKLEDLASAKGEEFGVKWELFKQETKMAAIERSSSLKQDEEKETRELN